MEKELSDRFRRLIDNSFLRRLDDTEWQELRQGVDQVYGYGSEIPYNCPRCNKLLRNTRYWGPACFGNRNTCKKPKRNSGLYSTIGERD